MRFLSLFTLEMGSNHGAKGNGEGREVGISAGGRSGSKNTLSACYVARKLFDFLRELADEMRTERYRECFVGHPFPDHLMFEGGEDSRTIPPLIYDVFLELFDRTEQIVVQLDEPDSGRLELNLSSNGLNPIVQVLLLERMQAPGSSVGSYERFERSTSAPHFRENPSMKKLSG